MSVDGAERRKQRIDALADHIREAGRSGIPFHQAIRWARRQQGLTEPTARGYIQILLESDELQLSSKDQRLRHIDVYPKATQIATP